MARHEEKNKEQNKAKYEIYKELVKIDSDPDHPARRDETRAQDVAISVPMHEQLFYLVGFHYSYDFLEVNYPF